jgi:hypothetical protein
MFYSHTHFSTRVTNLQGTDPWYVLRNNGLQKIAGVVSQFEVIWLVVEILQWGKTVLSPGTTPCQSSKRCSSSFQKSYMEREFLRCLNCSFYSPVLWYSSLHGAAISSPVPSPDLPAKRNNDVKFSNNCIPFIHIQYLRDCPLCARAQQVPSSPPPLPTENSNFLKNSSNELYSISVGYENHLPK